MALEIETPSWGYANSGTRFRVFPQPGVPRTVSEKLADAAQVQAVTGIAPSVALHIPWDTVDDYAALTAEAASLGVRIGAINPNLFQEEQYKFGSLAHPDAAVREAAVAHCRECIAIAQATGSSVISLWLADGTNYAGQDDIRGRQRRLYASLEAVAKALPAGMRLLLEYKPFEPAFYVTDLADWGAAYWHAARLGPQVQVLVDLGHHLPGTNVAQVVAMLLEAGKLGGFHFNNRQYADDDLIVGSTDPWGLFCIMHEIISAAGDPETAETARNIAYMIDQSHNVEAKIPAMIRSVLNVQEAYTKALLVDRAALAERQAAQDVLGAHDVLLDAYQTDVRPLLAQARTARGLPADPLAAFRASGYMERVAEEREGGTAAGWQ
jgi:L-rhamnose isomerase/sugar isomerase